MVGNRTFRCAKCGATSKEDSSLTFHRFPLPSKRDPFKAKVWAKFCFPNEDWSCDQKLIKLYNEHKLLCGKHFDDSSFTSGDKTRLNKFAIPTDAQNILAEIRKQPHNPSIPMETEASTSQCLTAQTEPIEEGKPHCPELSKNLCKGIIKELDVKTINELTPKKQKLYKRCRRNLTEILRLRRKFKKIKKCKRDILMSLESNDAVSDIIKSKLSSSFYLLLQSQLHNTSKKLAGRRWTLDDKVLALSIYRKSSSCYRLLRRLFCLPSITSLKVLLNKIPMTSGINNQVIETIKEMTQKRTLEENLCVVAFDEMAIRKNLTYNSKLDIIDGYQDHGDQGRTSEIASKALTFMAIGVRKNWKQPVAFYFSGAHVTADRLSVLIKEVLSACFNAGLVVIGIVCDCDGVNIRAVNKLGSTVDHPFFEHEGQQISTILDPPHLLKCFRNNFLKHNIEFTQELLINGQKSTGVAKWSHIEEFFNLEKTNTNFVFAPALTQQHLQPNGKQKMKVRLAAQVLSHSVAAGLYAKIAQNELPQEASATATVVSNMDKLFDAMNGNTPDRKRGKPYLTNMSSTSLHIELFQKMKFFFEEMKFLGARSKPPSQEGWLRTLNAMEAVFNHLSKQFNLNTVSLRRLNQDPLENCFGCIRSNCGSNPNPTSVQFVAALKTSIITNLINNNKNRNCLDDKNDILNNFKVFLCKSTDSSTKDHTRPDQKAPHGTAMDVEVADTPHETAMDVEMADVSQYSGEMQACAYVCGFIAKHIIENECMACKEIFLADQNTEVCHIFTSFKEYDEKKASLKYIQPSFCNFVENAATNINNYLKESSHKDEIKVNLRKKCELLNYDWLEGCKEHLDKNKSKIVESTIAICLKRHCILKNREFIEEASKQSFARKINILKNV